MLYYNILWIIRVIPQSPLLGELAAPTNNIISTTAFLSSFIDAFLSLFIL